MRFGKATFNVLSLVVTVVALSLISLSSPSRALTSETVASVVSVLPVWPGRAQGGAGAPPGVAPEGSGIVLPNGVIATAWHVVEPAERIDVRLSDGRILPAELIAKDAASDIALLSVDADLQGFEIATEPELAARACAIGNAWGLGISVTCGVVSALDVSDAGFNPVEHFVQTDAAANPGVSGGALVDADGRLLGMMSAIFASQGDTNIGVNFAVSTDLLLRVAGALLDYGEINYPDAGWRLTTPGREQLARMAAPMIAAVVPSGPADTAGLLPNDLVTHIASYRLTKPRDAVAALALLPEKTSQVIVTVERDGQIREMTLDLMSGPTEDAAVVRPDDCPHPAPVCALRQAVFPISSFDPVGSATRIGSNLLVTSRHVVANRPDAVVYTPDGPREGRVIASAYIGDLALIEVEGLPDTGVAVSLENAETDTQETYAIGADIGRQEVRVFDPGGLIAEPAAGAALGRVHVTSYMQPGVSGGVLTDKNGNAVGINAGGGEGRYEAIPLPDVQTLLALRADPRAAEITERLGASLAECIEVMEKFDVTTAEAEALSSLSATCAASQNHGQLLEAGRHLARAGAFDAAIDLHGRAVEQVPNSLNARISLLVSLQLAARFEDMTDHARQVMELAPNDPQVLRFAIQSGVWGNVPGLAEEAYQALLIADPMQAQAARRFIDSAPPAPPSR